ncbi:hypothetical protein H4R18_001340 [Coemansia javaensis]|uniref:Endopeptidase S2P n=1 Tax=Coemansia javaensis TaxID=2761396 RepID=A0A9W8HFT4_9FUNG|nr:hypothetical protein H4R18_001340 [Coemansia javaensis]
MSILLPVVVLGALWAAVNLGFALARRARPAALSDGSGSGAGAGAGAGAGLVSPLHLRVSTAACGDAIAAAAAAVPRRALDAFYSAGAAAGVGGMVLCVGVLAVAAAQIAAQITARITAALGPAGDGYGGGGGQRAADDRGGAWQTGGSGAAPLVLRPAIPGVTLPLGHAWQYVASLALCAAVHELGHALAAARAGVRVRRVGMFVVGIYPGAFVELARSQLERAPLAARLRVACAGVWHNALAALAAWLLLRSGGLGLALRSTGWAAAPGGVVAIDVARSSPLHGRLPLLSTIHRIDDVPLDPARLNVSAGRPSGADRFGIDRLGASPIARWTSVLTATRANRDTAAAGFCAAAADDADDGLCCEMSPRFPLGESPDSAIFCFEHFSPADAPGYRPQPQDRPHRRAPMCFDLRRTLEQTGAARCQSDRDCAAPGRQACVLPSSPFPDGRVLRLHYRAPGSPAPEMLVYAGAPAALWLDVQVSSLMPRWPWLPYRLPSWIETLVQYVLSFSLALGLLNATPARHLDGDLVLKLLVTMCDRHRRRSPHIAADAATNVLDQDGGDGNGDDDDDDDDEKGKPPCNIIAPLRSEPPHDADHGLSAGARRVYAAVSLATTALLAWCVVGSVVLLVL